MQGNDGFKKIQIPSEMYLWMKQHGDPDEIALDALKLGLHHIKKDL